MTVYERQATSWGAQGYACFLNREYMSAHVSPVVDHVRIHKMGLATAASV